MAKNSDDSQRTSQMNAIAGDINAEFGAGSAAYLGNFSPPAGPPKDAPASSYEARLNYILRPAFRGAGRNSPQGWAQSDG